MKVEDKRDNPGVCREEQLAEARQTAEDREEWTGLQPYVSHDKE